MAAHRSGYWWNYDSGETDDYDDEPNIPATPTPEEYPTGVPGVDYEVDIPPNSGECEDLFIISEVDTAEIEAQAKAEAAYRPADPKKAKYKQLSIFEMLDKKTEDEAE